MSEIVWSPALQDVIKKFKKDSTLHLHNLSLNERRAVDGLKDKAQQKANPESTWY